MLVAGGAGAPLRSSQMGGGIWFGAMIRNVGNGFSHIGDTGQFMVLRDGVYLVQIQLRLFDCFRDDSALTCRVNLVSSLHGIVTSFVFSEPMNLLLGLSHVANLSEGEVLRVTVQLQPSDADPFILDQVMTISSYL